MPKTEAERFMGGASKQTAEKSQRKSRKKIADSV
jgi:hypothetical protein